MPRLHILQNIPARKNWRRYLMSTIVPMPICRCCISEEAAIYFSCLISLDLFSTLAFLASIG